MRDDEPVWACCVSLLRPECHEPQEVLMAVVIDGELRNTCKWCRGPLVEVTTEELRQMMDARNDLQGGMP